MRQKIGRWNVQHWSHAVITGLTSNPVWICQDGYTLQENNRTERKTTCGNLENIVIS